MQEIRSGDRRVQGGDNRPRPTTSQSHHNSPFKGRTATTAAKRMIPRLGMSSSMAGDPDAALSIRTAGEVRSETDAPPALVNDRSQDGVFPLVRTRHRSLLTSLIPQRLASPTLPLESPSWRRKSRHSTDESWHD